MTFQTLDDKRDCKGVFYNGDFYFDKLPRNLDRTWAWSEHLGDYDVEFAEIWMDGKDIGECCPDHLLHSSLYSGVAEVPRPSCVWVLHGEVQAPARL